MVEGSEENPQAADVAHLLGGFMGVGFNEGLTFQDHAIARLRYLTCPYSHLLLR